MQQFTWADLETTWASQAAGSALYKHTDLVSMLCQAQHSVQAFEAAHPELVAQVQAAHPVVMADLPAASAFPPPSPTPGVDVLKSHIVRSPPKDFESLYRHHLVKIQAPMVRCSRPAFRRLCRLWSTDVSYTHMILADSFTRSPAARHADFALYSGEDKLVVQLAANSGPTAAAASMWLAPYCDAIDLNCGCPQRWAMRECLGAALLEKPEMVSDMVKCIRNAVPDLTRAGEDGAAAPAGAGRGGGFPCVVKMRVKDDIRHSVDFARQCVAAGASWLTVHGRTPHCAPSATVRWEAVRLLREVVTQDSSGTVPVVLNGGVNSPTEALEAALGCGVGAVMTANGLLDNPAMYHVPEAEAAALHFAPSGLPPPIPSWLPSRHEVQKLAPADSEEAAGALSTSPVALPGLPVTPLEVVSDFIRTAVATDLMFPTTVQQVLRMSRVYLSPAERVHMAMLRSNLSVLTALQQLGVYVDEGRYPLNW